jgi:hypothetical protein
VGIPVGTLGAKLDHAVSSMSLSEIQKTLYHKGLERTERYRNDIREKSVTRNGIQWVEAFGIRL